MLLYRQFNYREPIMFKNFIKLLLFSILSFSHLLYADEATTFITISNASANEASGKISFTVTIDELPLSIMSPVRIDYTTIDGTATAGDDYTAKTSNIFTAVWFTSLSSSTSKTIEIDLLDDFNYEESEYFYTKVSTTTNGHAVSGDGTGTGVIGDEDVQPFELDRFYSKNINETDTNQPIEIVAYFNQNTPAPLTLTYHTEDNSALAGSDYIAITDTINVPAGVDRVNLPVTIKGDYTPENTKDFKVIIDSISTGTVTDTSATIYIYDDDTIKVDVSCDDVQEGALGESNNIRCKIFLTKPYPVGEADFTIDYTSQDGSNPSATAGSDYTAVNGTITFTTGETEHIVNIPTIGDNQIEPDENVELFISGSDYIIDHESEAEIINDDGSFPSVNFSTADVSTVEGNSSSKMLNFHFSLDADAVEGSSFEYYTQDDDAKTSDNDYIEVNTTKHTVPVGTRDIDIGVIINGDLKIENDETFYLKFKNEENLTISGHTAKGHILNDDGSYPVMSIDHDTFYINEGNNSQKSLDFTLTLNKPALSNSSFEYYTQHMDTDGSDYVEINSTTHVFAGGESNLTISVQINGDTEVENDERFNIYITGEQNLRTSGTRSPVGIIVNDDMGEHPFSCDEQSYLFTSDQNASYSDYYYINLHSGQASKKQTFGISHINAIGYNVKDNYIYGLEYGNDNLDDSNNSYNVVKIDSQFNISRLNITGLPKGRYYLGDVSMNGIYYLANRYTPDNSFDRLQEIQRIDLNSSTLLTKVTLQYPVGVSPIVSADFAFNPKDNQLYMINANNNQLVRVNPSSGMVEELGDVGITESTYSVISFFDVDGNFYFYADGSQKIYKIDISNPASINATAHAFNNMAGLISSGDGARCANAPVTPPKEDDPFVCNSSMYISSSIKRGSGTTGKMWLHEIDTTQNPFAFNVVDDVGETKLYNALAYADSGDVNISNYIFGIYRKELIKLSRTGKVISLGEVSALPNIFATKQLFAGAIYDGYYYISGPGQDYDKIFKVKLSDKTVSEISLDKAISLLDFSFTPDGQYLHGIIDGGELVKIDLTVNPSTVTTIGTAHTGYQFDSTFSDKNGRFFANDSQGNGFFEFDLTTGEKLFLSASQQASFNDGANCLKEALVFNDYGDAPIGYGKPRHTIANGIFMGNEVDHDINPFDTLEANGDDINGIDDEDGVTFVDGTDINGSYFEVNTLQELNISVSKNGYLNAWLDFGIDGSFATAGDKIFTAKALTAGTHTINFNIPANVVKNKLTYLRFRYSSTANLDFEESATDGEVEDYAILFGSEVGQGIRGAFNIQRTNSALNAKDFALYTQIVGRDFDYHVVFYDENLTNEEQLVKVPLKIELVDTTKPMNAPLYTAYYYFSHSDPKSRIPVLNNSDLNALPATKEALFKITYATNENGEIVQQECGADYKGCFETLIGLSDFNRTNEAQDKFAIRPESFYITISDGTKERINSRYVDKTLKVASGYEYNLTMIATQYGGIEPSLGYNQDYNSSFDFNMTGVSNCANTDSIEQPVSYRDGIENISDFKHNNVGHYSLTQQTDYNWTTIDKADNDCILNSAITSSESTQKSGCNIQLQTHPINLEFYPDHFNVELIMKNLPSSGHPDFIYMSEVNSSYSDVAIAFKGEITAQSEGNTTTTNFTTGCVATNLLLDLNSSTVSVEGVNQNIKTIKGTNVDFSRLIRFNENSTSPTLELNQTLTKIKSVITINSNKFLNENNGTMELEMRYNLNKHLSEPINPVEVSFHGIEVESINAESLAHDKINTNSTVHTPTGEKLFTSDNQKNFYFARVVSDLNNYPTVNLNVSPLVRTPLNVDIFCNTSIANYCVDRKVINNTTLTATTREQGGWYISSNHHGILDGNVTNLNATPNIVTITPNPLNPIQLSHGENGLVNEKFIDCSSPEVTIKITTSPALNFEPSQYIINCRDNNASQWTGIGDTGNVLNVKPKVNHTGKMNW